MKTGCARMGTDVVEDVLLRALFLFRTRHCVCVRKASIRVLEMDPRWESGACDSAAKGAGASEQLQREHGHGAPVESALYIRPGSARDVILLSLLT